MRLVEHTITLSATDLAGFLGCRHRTGLDLAVALGTLQKPHWNDPVVEALRARGEEHERKFVDSLRAQGLTVVDLRDAPDGPEQTLAALHGGADVIVQAHLQVDGWLGYADVLRRVERPSALGAWSYEAYDTKLARDTRGGTILQLSVYSDLLAAIQGSAPEYFHVVTPDPVSPIHTYRVEEYAAYYRLMRQKLLDTIALGSDAICGAHYPDPVEHCDVCRWWLRCNARRRQDDHLAFIAGITRVQRIELAAHGHDTLAKAAAMALPLAFKPSRGAATTYERLREQARLQLEHRVQDRPVYELLDVEPAKGFCRLPEPSHGDLFLDLEGDPFAREGGREYLIGITTDGSHYRSWWAFDDAQERCSFEALIDYIVDRWAAWPDMHVYHFGHYEVAALKRLMGRHATRADALDRLLRGERFVDLHSVVRHALRAGVESYSIKKLEPFYAFARDVSLDDAGVSLRALELALESQAPDLISDATKASVEGYNRDDCRSTLALRGWLEQLRARVAQETEVPRPRPADETPSERVSELDAEVERLRQRLLQELPVDPHARTEAQRVRWMLAYLIDWHRREEKAEWWEFFRLCELPEEDLLDEPKAIAGLQFVERVRIVTQKNTGRPTGSVVDRYRFPIQDIDIRREEKLKLQDSTSFGTVDKIDRDARTIDVKKGKDNVDVHPSCVFAASVVPTETLQRSVMRLAGAVLGGATSGATDLLFRLPPRLTGEGFAQQQHESAVDFAVRMALRLDRTTLAVQGPPGSGKTYAGARMICALVNAGLRIGVTAVSHKVIRNLLDAVLREAAKCNVRIEAAHKVTDATEVPSPIAEITDNEEALARLASREVNVLGATAWLWAKDEAADAVDVLFVDEAGQMSLASVLAVAQAAKSVVLLGDPQQLDQPQKASHPDGIDISALEYMLAGAKTMPTERGLFLPHTWRLAPAICRFTSEAFYEGKLQSKPGLEHQCLAGTGMFDGAGLWWIPVDHDGNRNASDEEVDVVSRVADRLLATGARWVDEHGVDHQLTGRDLRVVAPYNAQVNRLAERLSNRGIPIGTVDKFQGQESPVVIYSMAVSRPEDAPKGMEFLYSLNRLNVATSRARCAVILIASPRLFEPECRTPRHMQLANALCRYREMAQEIRSGG